MKKLALLYQLYETTMAEIPTVCQKGCADCCTCNVTMTSLEAAFLVLSLDADSLAGVRRRLAAGRPSQRYRPQMTFNQFAMACMSGREIDEEENNPAWGRCPFLEDDICTIYSVRPFGCRSMMSQLLCQNTGYAQVPPLAMTMGHIFFQYIEHLDHQGVSANLWDMVTLYLENISQGGELGSGISPQASLFLQTKHLKGLGDTGPFIQNMKIPGLMVPPEHRAAVAPLLKQIAALTKTP